MYTCAPLSVSVTTQNGGRSLDVLRASRPASFWSRLQTTVDEASSSVFRKQNATQVATQRSPWTRFASRTLLWHICLFSHLNLVLSGFAHHKSDLGWSTFGCVHWSVVGKVAPWGPVPPGPGWKQKSQALILTRRNCLNWRTPSLVD